MKLSDNSIDRLQSSINRLVEKNRQLEKENQKLTKAHAAVESENETLSLKLEETTHRLNILTTSSSMIEVSGGAKAARQRINTLLREIDKCISLVNK